MPVSRRPSIRSIIGDQEPAREVQNVQSTYSSPEIDSGTDRKIDSETDKRIDTKGNNKGRMKTGYSLSRDLVRRITILAAVKETGANDLLEEGMQYILDKYEGR